VSVRIARMAATVQDARRRLTLSLVSLSIAELVAVAGIIAGWASGSLYPLGVLAVLALVLFFRLATALR
jgi:hypothetical protein